MSLPSYFDWKSREKEKSGLEEYLDYKPTEDLINTDDLEIWTYIFNTTPEELTAKPLDKSKHSIEWTPEEKIELEKEWGAVFKDIF